MATTSSFFRAPNKAEPQWLHDDDLFAQFIDADPLSLCNTSSGEANFTRATLGESSSVSELAGSFSADEDEDEDGGVELLASHQLAGGDESSTESATAAKSGAVPREIEDFIHLLTCEPTHSETPLEDKAVASTTTSGVPFPTTPLTPPPTETISTSQFTKSEHETTGTIRRHRKVNSSPLMAQPTSARHGQYDWAQKLEASAEQLDRQYQNGPMSPPSSVPLSHWSDDNMNFNQQSFQSNHTMDQQAVYHALQRYSVTPGTPYANAGSSIDPIVKSPQADRALSWAGNGTLSPFQFSFDEATSMHQNFDETKVQPWWPPNSMPYTDAGASSSFPHQQSRHQSYAQPMVSPMQASSYDHHPSSHSMSSTGLMIDTTSGLGPPFSPVPADPYQNQSHIVYPSDPITETYNQRANNYNRRRLSSEISQSQSRSSRSTSPTRRSREPSAPNQRTQAHRRGTSRSRSTHRNANASIDTHNHNQSQGPAHRRSKSQSASTPRSPNKGSSGGSAGAGFVNFTPQDSRRILTGVAPSGSSKTKARREKEAADRRRKFSLAAARAVMEAGGDVGKLEREGLLGVG